MILPKSNFNDLGNLNNRQLLYANYDPDGFDFESLPRQNWLALPVCNSSEVDFIFTVAENILKRNVNYVCACGGSSSLVHDIFDESIVGMHIEKYGEYKDDLPCIMTTFHDDLREGLYFAVYLAEVIETEINKIVIINMTSEDIKDQIQTNLINLDEFEYEDE